jgi:2-polyprenyl-3-methyl-5-hydroxy-6-metoxy-1,4-benzoquinol methylase
MRGCSVKPVVACSLCGETRWTTRESTPPFRVVECRCGLVFVTPQPDWTALKEAYDQEYYGEWADQARQRERLWRRRLALVERVSGGAGRLLDVGIGTGAFLTRARARGWHVAGTEISAYAVKTGVARGLDVVEGEIWEAALPAGAFDVVTCWHVLEHVRDPRRVLEEACRVLRPGGWLFVATPNLEDRLFRLAYWLVRRRPLRLFEPEDREVHLFHFSARTLAALVTLAGFSVSAVGFDRGAAVVWSKALVNEVAYLWFRLSGGLNWGMGLELVARKPGVGTP